MVDFSERTEKVWNNFNELELQLFDSLYFHKSKFPSLVKRLQKTRDVYAQLELPSCYEAAHSSYLEYMDLTIESWSYVVEGGEAFDSKFLDFMDASAIALSRAIDQSKKLGK